MIYRWASRESAQWWVDYVTGPGLQSQTEKFWYAVEIQWANRTQDSFDGREETPEPNPTPAGPPAPPTPPPKWKMAVVTLIAVFPPVLLFNVLIIPQLLGLPTLLRTLVLCIGVTGAVTWVMMPRLMPLFKGWLHPPAHKPPPSAEWLLRAASTWREAMFGPDPRSQRPSGNRRGLVPLRDEETGRAYTSQQMYRRDSQPTNRHDSQQTYRRDSQPTNRHDSPTSYRRDSRTS